jgi:hypothetical protein
MIFCTLFNWAYLPQGVALYRSLERTRGADFILYVLCMDPYTQELLEELALPNMRLIALDQVEDEALLAVKEQRSFGEYCWTCTTPLLQYVLGLWPEGRVVSYVDADIAFYNDPQAILDELGDGSIFIHEHDFAPEHQSLAITSGRFNVGVTSFRNDEQGRACLARWRRQCIEECVMDPAANKCGDQNYLDEWPDLYPGLVISRNPGVGTAPWNITKYQFRGRTAEARVDGRPVVFYHYHTLKLLRPRLGVKPTLIAVGNYSFSEDVVEGLYHSYVAELWSIIARYPKLIENLKALPDVTPRMKDEQVVFALAGRYLPFDRNNVTMSYLYGIDARRNSEPLRKAA